MKNSAIIPSIGRIVHYVIGGGHHRPAIIVRVWDQAPKEDSVVQLQVFTDGSNDGMQNVEWHTSVHQDASGIKPGTWHARSVMIRTLTSRSSRPNCAIRSNGVAHRKS